MGSYAGESAAIFLERAGEVWCVDSWTPYVERNDSSVDGVLNPWEAERKFDLFAAEHHGHVFKVKLASPGAALFFPRQWADCVYIDENHERDAVIAGIIAWGPVVKPGGVLAGHDYGTSHFTGVTAAVKQCFGDRVRQFEDTTWAVEVGSDGLVQGAGAGEPGRGQA